MKNSLITNAEDFKCLLLTYLAEADYKVTLGEKAIILQHVSAEKYKQIKMSIDHLSDFECLDLINSYKAEFLPNQESINSLISEMELLSQADKKESILEKNMVLGLKKILLSH